MGSHRKEVGSLSCSKRAQSAHDYRNIHHSEETMIGKYYNHDPRHFRFARTMEGISPIENKAERSVWRILGIVAVVVLVLVM